MPAQKPDYTHGLYNLAASVLRHYGIPTPQNGLPEMDEELKASPRNVVVLLLDGMGTAVMDAHLAAGSFLMRHRRATISSVFPPTTTAATTTMETGLSPIEHGWLGWRLYFEEIGQNVALYPNTLENGTGAPAAAYHVARRYLPYKTLYERMALGESVSPFSRHRCETLESLCETLPRLCAPPGRHYFYAYCTQPDTLMHEKGVAQAEVTGLLNRFDTLIEGLSRALSDTLLVITADHGMADVAYHNLAGIPALCALFARPPAIENRCMAFYLKDGCGAAFERAFSALFGDAFMLLPSPGALELFGPGVPHPRSLGFLGDYLAIATQNLALDYNPGHLGGDYRPPLAANHAGITPAEMNVPFIALRCV